MANEASQPGSGAIAGAWPLLLVLTGINLVNYVDRYVLSAVLPLVKGDLLLSDASLGMCATAFMVSYLIFSPAAGQAGDRMQRKYIAGAAVFLWSLATVASGLSRNYGQLLASRAFTGIGEAGYATVAPSMISDVFPKTRRGSALSIFYAALPVGSAIGFSFGGFWGEHFGWRSAFFLAGAPGMILSIITLFLKEPVRGMSDGIADSRDTGSAFRVAVEMMKIPSFRTVNLGMAAYTFSIGGLAFWAPTFLNRIRGIELSRATFVFGLFTVVAGFAGTICGGVLCDYWRKSVKRAYVLIPGISLIFAFPPLIVFFRAQSPAVFWPVLFVAVFLLFINTGPLNAALLNVVEPYRRARAIAVNILLIHLLGDALSPLLIGKLSDMFNLLLAVQVISLACIVAAVILIAGSKHLPGDEERIKRLSIH